MGGAYIGHVAMHATFEDRTHGEKRPGVRHSGITPMGASCPQRGLQTQPKADSWALNSFLGPGGSALCCSPKTVEHSRFFGCA